MGLSRELWCDTEPLGNQQHSEKHRETNWNLLFPENTGARVNNQFLRSPTLFRRCSPVSITPHYTLLLPWPHPAERSGKRSSSNQASLGDRRIYKKEEKNITETHKSLISFLLSNQKIKCYQKVKKIVPQQLLVKGKNNHLTPASRSGWKMRIYFFPPPIAFSLLSTKTIHFPLHPN